MFLRDRALFFCDRLLGGAGLLLCLRKGGVFVGALFILDGDIFLRQGKQPKRDTDHQRDPNTEDDSTLTLSRRLSALVDEFNLQRRHAM